MNGSSSTVNQQELYSALTMTSPKLKRRIALLIYVMKLLYFLLKLVTWSCQESKAGGKMASLKKKRGKVVAVATKGLANVIPWYFRVFYCSCCSSTIGAFSACEIA